MAVALALSECGDTGYEVVYGGSGGEWGMPFISSDFGEVSTGCGEEIARCWVALPGGVEAAIGTDWRERSGCYLLDWNGETIRDRKLLEEYVKNDMGKRIVSHVSLFVISYCVMLYYCFKSPGILRGQSFLKAIPKLDYHL